MNFTRNACMNEKYGFNKKKVRILPKLAKHSTFIRSLILVLLPKNY